MIYDFSHMINRIADLYDQRDRVTYCLGCAGQVAGRDKMVEDQFKYYYNTNEWKYKIGNSIPGWVATDTADQAWNKWLNLHRGKMCFDCSGLICWAMGYEGIHIYSSWDFGAMPKNESIGAGVAGSVLWKKGHVAIDCSYGALFEIGAWGGTIEYHMNIRRNFTSSHLIPEVDYTGATNR